MSTSGPAKKRTLRLRLDAAHPGAQIDLTRYSLGQGGLSPDPMIDDHIRQLRNLKPRIIRFFVQEYFDIYPRRGKPDFTKLDRMLEAIRATGARPLPAICFKPRALFPVLDEDIVHPTSYPEWQALIRALVTHCTKKGYGIEYWEIGNEPNEGDAAGSPYRFKPEDYVTYYRHTATAILQADPGAKVGGPALARWYSPIGEALIDYCGTNRFPLHFFSWHLYNDDTEIFREGIRKYKALLGRHPSLKNTETMVTEWNQNLVNFNHDPCFQPAHILEVTKIFEEEGLDWSAYYHIRDYCIADEMRAFTGKKWVIPTWEQLFDFNSHLGIYDLHGRVRPSYYVFKCLSLLVGERLPVIGVDADIKSFAVRNGDAIQAVIWNFPARGVARHDSCSLDLSALRSEGWRLKMMRLTSAGPEYLEEVCMADVKELKRSRLEIDLPRYGIVLIQLLRPQEVIDVGPVTTNLGHQTSGATKRTAPRRAAR